MKIEGKIEKFVCDVEAKQDGETVTFTCVYPSRFAVGDNCTYLDSDGVYYTSEITKIEEEKSPEFDTIPGLDWPNMVHGVRWGESLADLDQQVAQRQLLEWFDVKYNIFDNNFQNTWYYGVGESPYRQYSSGLQFIAEDISPPEMSLEQRAEYVGMSVAEYQRFIKL